MGGNIKSYKDLIVWQKAIALVTDVYDTTKSLPKEETYGLTAQLRRCSVSIPSNIAEGYGRNSTYDYIRFLQIACGSLYELQTQLIICSNLKYLSKEQNSDITTKSEEIEKMLVSLIKKLKRTNSRHTSA